MRNSTFRAWQTGEIDVGDGVWRSPVVAPGHPSTALVASWNVHTPHGTWVEVRVRVSDKKAAFGPWMVLARWCSDLPEDGGAIARTTVKDQRANEVYVDDDTLRSVGGHSFDQWQLEVECHAARGEAPEVSLLGAVSWLVLDEVPATSEPGAASGLVIDVPALSQGVHRGHYPQWDGGGEAWCSPTSVAMLLRHWSVPPTSAETSWVDPPVDADVDHAARGVYDHAYAGCGNWPFNTAYAATRGLEAFVTVLRSLRDIEELVVAGLPVVVSVSFTRDELDGSGYDTSGHLLVVCGFTESGDVVVNDPASHEIPESDEVRVVYRRGQFERVWLRGIGGIAYVLRPPQVPLPPALALAPSPLVHRAPNW